MSMYEINNNTQTSSNIFTSPTLLWCLIMPLIHFLSLISNILCIIVFCSKTFIHKPIAIYFICLLISDSTTLLIGYTEMIDRESTMTDKSSTLCMFNGKIIHGVTEIIYTFMGKFCLEWMLYKVLWTRASTILLAILSIQRSRTFFSLSYHESRFCALLACLMSILIASLITCFEWISVQCNKSTDSDVYIEIFQSIMNTKFSKEFYSNYLNNHYNESIDKYYCLIQSLDINPYNTTILTFNEYNCSTTEVLSEFHSLTQSFLSSRNTRVTDSISNILTNIYDDNYYLTNTSVLTQHLVQARTPDLIIKLFEKRSCHITMAYSICLKLFDFLHSISFGLNRHTLAIFLGNALPSFIVFLANVLSLKVIYFSKSLKYLKQKSQKNRRKRRIQNDLRAFLVILIESFSVITISWGIPILLTMYYCQTLYVVAITECPEIKKSLVYFLFPDLFNSSTNCLLYSLSGKLFRRKFISLIKGIFTCGRGVFWNVKQSSLMLPMANIELQPSNDPSTVVHNGIYSRVDTYRHSELFSSIQINKLKKLTKNKKIVEDDASSCVVRISDERNGSNETELEFIKKIRISNKKLKRPQKFKTFLIDKVQFLSSTESRKEKNKLKTTVQKKRQLKATLSLSSSTGTAASNENSLLRQQLNNQQHVLKIVLVNTDDNQTINKECVLQNVTTL
ncbi:unnamed protein product [Adineta steineri]|uniref:G-protein coupled receptors family 1 profile domain-containing protein n=1 Tax=Adineta steineri TaxID=433720 RepID=A0A815Z1F3_9BILA|nr:unnamed protein product [Adineta steineri]CAF1576891.1 unnamed protein product [Adineta steineri]